MSARSAEERRLLVEQLLRCVDPRLAPEVRRTFSRSAPGPRPAATQTVVIAGHRTAGKSRLLPGVAQLLGRPAVDLDTHLERVHGRALRDWVAAAPTEFRAAERRGLLDLPAGSVVAVGGGFLSHHPDALAGMFTLLVPISFETYRERLLADKTRPRLRPHLTLEEEISSLFHEREVLHANVPTVALADFLRGCLDSEEAS